MTEISVAQPRHLDTIPAEAGYATLTATAPDPTGGRLVAWHGAAVAAASLASALCRTSFVPKAFAGKPEETAAALLLGDELGLSPLAALRSIHVISGTPGLYARTMVALVQSHGHEVVPVDDTPAKVTVKGRRAGSDEWVTSTWTTERARRAGYTSNKKYETDPQAMLYARAASDVCRRIAADVLLGIPYSVEEIELEQPEPTRRVSRSTTTVSRVKPAPSTEDEPSFDEPGQVAPTEATEPATAPEVPSITPAQSKRLHASFGSLGITERADRLAYVADVIGREVESSNDLDIAEAGMVIDRLEADRLAAADPGDTDGGAA